MASKEDKKPSDELSDQQKMENFADFNRAAAEGAIVNQPTACWNWPRIEGTVVKPATACWNWPSELLARASLSLSFYIAYNIYVMVMGNWLMSTLTG